MLNKKSIQVLLSNNRTKSSFFHIPKDLLLEKICGINADNALDAVIQTDYQKLWDVLSILPSMMFEKGLGRLDDGTVINIGPLEYALSQLDTHAWRICLDACENNEKLLQRFFRCVMDVKNIFDLKPVENAYQDYLKAFEDPDIKFETLKTYWLNVGTAQKRLPKHFIREMCSTTIESEVMRRDIVLVLADKDIKIQDIKLNELDRDRPIVFKRDNEYEVYKLTHEGNWEGHHIQKIIPNTNFKHKHTYLDTAFKCVKERNTPVLYHYQTYDDSGLHGPWQALFKHDLYGKYPIMQEFTLDFLDLENNILNLVAVNWSDLGSKYTLARGDAPVCLGLSHPRGQSGSLNYRAQQDLKTIKSLYELRKSEKELLLNRDFLKHHSISDHLFSIGIFQ